MEEKERQLLKVLLNFRSVTEVSSNEMNPSAIANYCIDIAKAYNQFYHENQILKADEPSRGFRVGLTALTSETIKSSMALLGIKVPERM